jgi:quinol monooxygenase YgiN
MSKNVYWVLEAAINPGRIEDLNVLMAEMVESTQETEPGALNFEWAISDDHQVCHIYERYQDSSATITHLKTFGEKFAERFAVVVKVTRFVLYGHPNKQVIDALAGFSPVYMEPLGGFSRNA